MNVLSAGRRAWLLSEAPASRAQAAWGNRYRLWLQLRSNPLTMAGLLAIVALVLVALAAPLLATHDPGVQDLARRLQPPTAAHWLGTDELGRDIWSRIVFGARITLGMVIAVVLLVAPVGLAVGCVAGYAGGLWDRLLMRVTDIFLAFPRLILALAFVAALRPGVESAVAQRGPEQHADQVLVARDDLRRDPGGRGLPRDGRRRGKVGAVLEHGE